MSRSTVRAAQATVDNICRMRVACWITKDTDTHWEYVTIIAFPLQKLLHERVSVLRYSGADKSLARPGSKRATATEDFDVHISYL